MAEIVRQQKGPRMSGVVAYGDTVYLAGVVATDPEASMAEQTRQCLAQIDERLRINGTDKSKLLSATVWITDMAMFNEMNEVWDAWIDPDNPPARACVTANLARPALKVEIMSIAAR